MPILDKPSLQTSHQHLLADECRQLSIKLFLQGQLHSDDILRWFALSLRLNHNQSGEEGCRYLAQIDSMPADLNAICWYYLSLFLLKQGKFGEVIPALQLSLNKLAVAHIEEKAESQAIAIMSQKAATNLLLQTLNQLHSAGVQGYAHAGSLLGLIREGRVLPFDKDLDIGLMQNQLSAAHNTLLQHGWVHGNTGLTFQNMPSYKHKASGVTLDLCGKRRDEYGQLLGGFVLNENLSSEWRRDTLYPDSFELEEIETEYGGIWQVTNPEAWLENIYGPEWRTPDKGFDTVIAANNLQGFSKLTEWFAYSKVIRSWSYGHFGKAYSLCEQVIERHQLSGTCFNKAAIHLAQRLNDNTERL